MPLLRWSIAFFLLPALLQGCAGESSRTADAEPLTVFVAIDEASRATIGDFPVDREVYARAIRAAKKAGARGFALKFFIDRPMRPEGDAALAAAERELPTLLQAFPSLVAPGFKEPPAKIARKDWDLGATPEALKVPGLAYPLPELMDAAHALGHAEVREDGVTSKVELARIVETQGGIPAQSLQLAIVELGLGKKASVSGNHLRIGARDIALDPQGRVPCPVTEGPSYSVFGIDQLLAGTIPPKRIEGKVVVLGYLRADSPKVPVDGNQVLVHAMFYRQAACLAKLVAQ